MSTDIKQKTIKDLLKNLSEKREELRKIRFAISGSNKKDVRQIRNLKKEIARILTEVNSRNK